MADTEKIRIIKSRVSIQSYFDDIIVPTMTDYYDNGGVDLESYPVCRCPFHMEDTASFRYYSHTSSFYCFGCGVGGDILNLHKLNMTINHNEEVSTDNTVDFLYDRFVEGNSAREATNTRQAGIQEEKLSTNVEIARFTSLCSKLEQLLLESEFIQVVDKAEGYSILDLSRVLIRLNKVNATEARQEVLKVYTNLSILDKQMRKEQELEIQ